MEERKEVESVYLYVACYNNENQKNEAFIAVTKAMLLDEVATIVESVGDHAILFTSIKTYEEIKEKLNNNKVSYLLINVGVSFDLECISGFIPDSKIEIIKNITEQKFSKNKPFLNRIFEEALLKENFELAAPIIDLSKKYEKK